ncbi:hypothetical protein RND81_12G236000 [Saponaria officinalis]|uniref:TCP domain-containing protein n=1 Tax=Saponaria officinalis TaxID=3572 RepID=A0AAW1HEK8_SAPOF
MKNSETQAAMPVPGVSSRSALRRAGMGEIVEVEGGHIVRATGRKDRHSKVCTAKGARDRRVRLAAHTAIQFYDVQDRLGYDRPSKAVDWLITKARASIDELHQLPAWTPTSVSVSSSNRRKAKPSGGGGGGGDGCNSKSLLPPSVGSDAIAETIKSFFPVGDGTTSGDAPSQAPFRDYSYGGGGGGGGQSQDLRLSLQSFQEHDSILMHSQHQTEHQQQQQLSVFAGAGPIGIENPNVGWAESQNQPSPELGRLHRLVVGWQNHQHNTSIDHHHHHHSGDDGGGDAACVGLETGGGSGFVFNQNPLLQQQPYGSHHGQFFTQRGPLQSNNTPSSIRAWISDPPSIATSSEHHLQAISVYPQGFSGLRFPSGGFSGFHFPTRILGEEEHDGHLKPSSASSASRH